MRDMSKEGCDLTERIIRGTFRAKPRIRIQSIEKRRPGVEVLPGAARVSLINNPIKEFLCHNIRDRDIVTSRSARTGLAAGAAVVVAGATVPPLAATLVRGAAAVLSHRGPRQGSGEDAGEKD